MRRLYVQVYATFLGILVVVAGLVILASVLLASRSPEPLPLAGLGAVLQRLVPDPARPASELQAVVTQLGALLHLSLAVQSAEGTLLATAGPPIPTVPWERLPHGGPRWRGPQPTLAVPLPDGRVVVVGVPASYGPRSLPGALGVLAVASALGAYPVVRRLTRRLERLQARVDALGAGDLNARVAVEGRDEVARLAQSFNRAAERIAQLVTAQRTMLAGASHELRSPLARIRLAIELLPTAQRPELRERLSQDIAELDALIGELLLASRLDALEALEHTTEVDLLALLAEEGARTAAEVSGTPVCIQGDPQMLRRLMRNLLENAQRYAADSVVEAAVEPLLPTGARLCVADRGPGVPEEERERIFAPFYRPVGLQRRNDGGVGLGLALVRQIAQHHGGTVRCLPREGGGTCFEVTLSAHSSGTPGGRFT